MNEKIKLLLIEILLLTFNAYYKDDDSSLKTQSTSINKILALVNNLID